MLNFNTSPAMEKWDELVNKNKVLESRYDETMAEIVRLKELNREMYNAIDYYMTLMNRSNPGGAPEWEWEKADEMMREAFTKAEGES